MRSTICIYIQYILFDLNFSESEIPFYNFCLFFDIPLASDSLRT